jgi:protein-tyrosine phosphatase
MQPAEDRTAIYRTLWQGAKPAQGWDLAHNGFQAVVLCAPDYQPPSAAFHNVAVIRCPFEDNPEAPPTDAEVAMVDRVAKQVALRVRRGEKVLVSCFAGLNRSGLVTAKALYRLTGWDGRTLVQYIRSRRPVAFSNRFFVELLSKLPARTTRV